MSGTAPDCPSQVPSVMDVLDDRQLGTGDVLCRLEDLLLCICAILRHSLSCSLDAAHGTVLDHHQNGGGGVLMWTPSLPPAPCLSPFSTLDECY